jgi:hypothetical protein
MGGSRTRWLLALVGGAAVAVLVFFARRRRAPSPTPNA